VRLPAGRSTLEIGGSRGDCEAKELMGSIAASETYVRLFEVAVKLDASAVDDKYPATPPPD